MIAEQDQLSPEPSDLDSATPDKHSAGDSGMNDRQVKRAISASSYSGVQRRAGCETLDDLAALVRKEVHDYMQRAAQWASEHGDEGSDDDRNGTTGGGRGG